MTNPESAVIGKTNMSAHRTLGQNHRERDEDEVVRHQGKLGNGKLLSSTKEERVRTVNTDTIATVLDGTQEF